MNTPLLRTLGRRGALAAALLALALLAAPLAGAADSAAPAPAQEPPRPRLKVFRVGMGGPQNVGGLGTVRCYQVRDLGFAVPGVLALVVPEEGEAVKKGQVVAKLDDQVLVADLGAKRAEMNEAAAEVHRLEAKKQDLDALVQARAATRADAVEAGFALEAARARVARVRAELGSLAAQQHQQVLRAPLAGIVLERKAEPGEVVTPQNPVLEMGDCARVLAEVEFGERLYHALKLGQSVSISADAVPGRAFTGKLYAKSPRVDDKNRTFLAKVLLDNPDLVLKPGMFVRAVVSAGPAEQLLWVPRAALADDNGKTAEVGLLVNGKPERRAVTLGRRAGEKVEVVSGLESGDLVLLPESGPGAPEEPAEPGRTTR